LTEPTYHPERAIEVLLAHGVKFIVVGGIAATLHGSPMMTVDLDISYERTHDNLKLLAAALVQMNARLRGVDQEVPFLLDAETLKRGSNFTFDTDAGPLDCLGWVDGIGGYEDLARRAVDMSLTGHSVTVASLDDLIVMKKAAGRVKDERDVLHLEAIKEMTEGS
jgi:predicted nucleotidyltransferase